ncbi:MAG TPA: MBL fold metallo-hydrolase [Candidatus Dormibacteraeota bacterium]|jgi:L-ascorbate metabolism protein UlaG (beta-lactamase superfamily)|nr:MBL fold metallo-hydrolase [Candidatus Dormibacteraeota bacterium]
MEISFVGHACFRLRGREASVVVDPYGKGLGLTTLTPSKFAADILTISHDHPGHNNSAMVGGEPKIVDCPGEYEIRGVAIRGVAAYHDNEKGVKLGKVTLFAIEIDDVVVAHLGDLGHPLTELQQEQLGAVDVLLVPAGGGTALSATQAAEVTNQVEPKIVVPMHYKLPGMKLALDEPKHFASEMGIDKIEYQPKLSLSGKPSNDETRVVFLEARGANPG